MKNRIIYCLSVILLLIINFSARANIHLNIPVADSIKINCTDTNSISLADFQQFDCRSQSCYTSLAQGDSFNLTIIVYASQDFRITAFCDKNLGNIRYKIIEPVRENIQKVKKVNENEEIIYKLDEYGEQILGSDDKPVVLSKEMLRDTIWDKNVVVHENILFDSENSAGASFFDIANLVTTKRLLVKLKVYGNSTETQGCVTILVGRKYMLPFKIGEKE